MGNLLLHSLLLLNFLCRCTPLHGKVALRRKRLNSDTISTKHEPQKSFDTLTQRSILTIKRSTRTDWILALGMHNTGENAQRLEKVKAHVCCFEDDRSLCSPVGLPCILGDFNSITLWSDFTNTLTGKFECITFDDSVTKFLSDDWTVLLHNMARLLYPTGSRLVLPLTSAMYTTVNPPDFSPLSDYWKSLARPSLSFNLSYLPDAIALAQLSQSSERKQQVALWKRYRGQLHRHHIIDTLLSTGLFSTVKVVLGHEARPFDPHPAYGDPNQQFIVATRNTSQA